MREQTHEMPQPLTDHSDVLAVVWGYVNSVTGSNNSTRPVARVYCHGASDIDDDSVRIRGVRRVACAGLIQWRVKDGAIGDLPDRTAT